VSQNGFLYRGGLFRGRENGTLFGRKQQNPAELWEESALGGSGGERGDCPIKKGYCSFLTRGCCVPVVKVATYLEGIQHQTVTKWRMYTGSGGSPW